jgi:hypothetical protein
MAIDKGYRRHRNTEYPLHKTCDPVERFLGRRIDNVIALKSRQSVLLALRFS